MAGPLLPQSDPPDDQTSDLDVPRSSKRRRHREPSPAAPGTAQNVGKSEVPAPEAIGKSKPQNAEGVGKPEAQKSASSSEATIHLLAFGDSLTAGGFGSEPYPKQLEKKLNALGMRDGHRQIVLFKVHNAGICGEDTSSMVERLPEELEQLKKETGRAPAYVLLLGGTNDLGGLEPDAILRNLSQLRFICRRWGSEPVAMTIPRDEFGFNPSARIVNKRLKFSSSFDEPNFLLADLSTVPEEHLTDGVHFSSEGYALFADIILKALRGHLEDRLTGR